MAAGRRQGMDLQSHCLATLSGPRIKEQPLNAKQRISLHMLLDTYTSTEDLKDGTVRSDSVKLDFASVPRPNNAFKRVVRDLEFDVAELAIITFLMAKSRGKPLVLLPAVMIGRFQHPYIVYNV